jgi:hypothetical protein
MWRYGEDWLWAAGSKPPIELYDQHTGKPVRPIVVDENTGDPIDVRRLRIGGRR